MVWLYLITVMALAAAAIAFSVRRSRVGFGPWLCYQLARLQSVLFTRWTARNQCTYPPSGAAIIVANHTSPVDPVILWIRHFAGFPEKHMRIISYMMAREYYQRRDPVGWVCRVMRAIPVDRSGRDFGPVRHALTRLENGHLVGLFPEGRLNLSTPDEQLLPGGTGVAWLALKSRVPVLPVFIHNAPRGKTMVSSFFIRTRTMVTYGEPVDLSPWLDRKLTHSLLAEATDQIMQSLAVLGGVRYTPTRHSRLRLPAGLPDADEVSAAAAAPDQANSQPGDLSSANSGQLDRETPEPGNA